MTPKKKAEDLITSFKGILNCQMVSSTRNAINTDLEYDINNAVRDCCLVVCYSMISEYWRNNEKKEYWRKIKGEIEKQT